MDKRQKGTIIPSGDENTDLVRVVCINKILRFDESIDFSKFDFLFGTLQNRPKRLIKLLISLECLTNLNEIAKIVLNIERKLMDKK